MGALPEALRQHVFDAFNDAALKQRADMEASTIKLQAQLQSHGLTFNDPEFQSFRDALRASGFYAEWREQSPAEGWSLLEKSTGPLA